MGHRGGGPGEQELEGQRTADMIRSADDHRVLPLGIHADSPQQGHHAEGRAGAQHRDALGQPADGIGVKPVDVLHRTDVLDDRQLVDVRRQRQLHENAVDGGIVVELGDEPRAAPLSVVSRGRS